MENCFIRVFLNRLNVSLGLSGDLEKSVRASLHVVYTLYGLPWVTKYGVAADFLAGLRAYARDGPEADACVRAIEAAEDYAYLHGIVARPT